MVRNKAHYNQKLWFYEFGSVIRVLKVTYKPKPDQKYWNHHNISYDSNKLPENAT